MRHVSLFSHGSLFSGVGGWSVASNQMGWSTAFACEWDENKQYILKHHWPNAEIYGDITNTDFTIWRGLIDILTASTPCQPFSLAGKRAGSDDVRHLWPETHRAIREIQPQWFVLENVPGLVNWSKGMVFKQIIADLENEGYEVLPFLLPACGVNAPHKRERIWIVAYNDKERSKQKHKLCAGGNLSKEWTNQSGITSDTPGHAITGQYREGIKIEGTGITVNESIRRGQFETVQFKGLDDISRPAADSDKAGHKGDKLGRTSEPDRTGSKRDCKRQSFESTSELHQTTNWLDFPTVSPLRSGDDGFSRESLRSFINENSGGLLTEKEIDQIIQKSLNKWNNETIAAGGDAVVNQVVYHIFKAIEQYNNL